MEKRRNNEISPNHIIMTTVYNTKYDSSTISIMLGNFPWVLRVVGSIW